MTKKNIISLLITIIICCLAVVTFIIAKDKRNEDASATSKVSKSLSEEIAAAGKVLIPNNYEVARVFKIYSIPGRTPFDAEAYPENIVPVDSNVYQSYAELENFVRNTFIKEVADKILNEKKNDTTHFMDIDGELCKTLFFVNEFDYKRNWEELEIQYKNMTKTSADVEVTLRAIEKTKPVLGAESVAQTQAPTYEVLKFKMVKIEDKWLLEDLVY